MSASQIAENPQVENKTPKKDQNKRHDVEDKKLKNLLEKYENAQDESLKKSEPCPQKNAKPPISKPSGNIGGSIRPTQKPIEKPTDITSQSGIQNQITDRTEENKVEKKVVKESRVIDKVLDETSQSNTVLSSRLSPEQDFKIYKSKFPEQETKNLPPRQVDLKKKTAPSPVTTTPIKKPIEKAHKRNVSEPEVKTVSKDSKKKELPNIVQDNKSDNGSEFVEEESSILPAQSDTPKVNPILKRNPLLANMKIGGLTVSNYGFSKHNLNNPLLKIAMTPKKQSVNATPNKSTTPAKSDRNEKSRNDSTENTKAQDNKRSTINHYANSRRTPNMKDKK